MLRSTRIISSATRSAAKPTNTFSAATRRNLSTSRPAAPRSAKQLAPTTALAITAATLTYSLWQLKPELLPSLPLVQADAEPVKSSYVDPTTSTPFATEIVAPSGNKLRLVGTGVRTVSFLSIRVYAAGYYVEESVLEKLAQVEGWKGFTPDKLLPPFPKPTEDGITGEALIGKLLDVADVAVIIMPLRNTTLPHLRDGFSRALVARLKLPHVASALSEKDAEGTSAALTDLKSFFPGRTLPKNAPLELYFSSKPKTVRFQLRKMNGDPEVLGTLSDPTLAKELFLSYFSDSLETSIELRTSVAKGLAGEPRG